MKFQVKLFLLSVFCFCVVRSHSGENNEDKIVTEVPEILKKIFFENLDLENFKNLSDVYYQFVYDTSAYARKNPHLYNLIGETLRKRLDYYHNNFVRCAGAKNIENNLHQIETFDEIYAHIQRQCTVAIMNGELKVPFVDPNSKRAVRNYCNEKRSKMSKEEVIDFHRNHETAKFFAALKEDIRKSCSPNNIYKDTEFLISRLPVYFEGPVTIVVKHGLTRGYAVDEKAKLFTDDWQKYLLRA